MGNHKTLNIIDVEASGLGKGSYPIEIGIVLESGERYCSLILPEEDWTHWDEKAAQVHNISRKTLRLYGKPVDEVATELNTLFHRKTLYTDGWVVDKPWLTLLFHRAKKQMAFYVSPLEIMLSEEQMSIWDDVKKEVIQEMNLTRHRATNDARIIQETYLRTLNSVN